MDNKYKNKYRIPSARLPNWDYRWSGAYFITICTDQRNHFFGAVVNGTMKLSSIGVIADILWYEIKNRNKNIALGKFVVMPNHIHGIIILNNDNADIDDNVDDNVIDVETGHALSLRQSRQSSPQPSEKINRFQNIGKNSISSIVGGYKSAVTKHARRLGFEFGWQTRFHDHIIRDDKSFENISNYIVNNPKKWEEDKFY